ncbi:MAG TPA: enoyl-CoA hydratase-related protein [Glycomyces sp.]|nr:enoyl-CoA hydratase-related protein [Glycomyces sp.]
MESNDALIRYRAAHKVATVTLDNPERRNALSLAMIAQLRAAIARASADPEVRAIVLDHSGPVFCAGADLTESAAATDLDGLPAAHLAELLADVVEAPKPVIALACGSARGGGTGLLAAADIALIATAANVSFGEVRLGVVPAVIAPVVARRLSPALMRQLFLTAETMQGDAAVRYGVCDMEVENAEDPSGELAWAASQLLRGGPSALAGVKRLTAGPELRGQLRSAAALTAEYFFSDEGREGVRSFIEKRAPSWVH